MSILKGYRALVVEDDADLCEIVADDLRMYGAEVEIANSGMRALEILTGASFDFILSDMRMANGDGRFLAQELLKLDRVRPLLFMYSGYNDITESEALTLKIERIFSKPFKSSAMVEVIRTFLIKRS